MCSYLNIYIKYFRCYIWLHTKTVYIKIDISLGLSNNYPQVYSHPWAREIILCVRLNPWHIIQYPEHCQEYRVHWVWRSRRNISRRAVKQNKINKYTYLATREIALRTMYILCMWVTQSSQLANCRSRKGSSLVVIYNLKLAC